MRTDNRHSKTIISIIINLLFIQFLWANQKIELQQKDTIKPIATDVRTFVRTNHSKSDSSFSDSVKIVQKKFFSINFIKPPLRRHTMFSHALGPIAISQVVSMLFLFSRSKEQNNWDHNFGRKLFNNAGVHLKNAWTKPPRWDDDPAITNYVQHPYAGSFYYNTIRNKGASPAQSFGIAFFGSTVFEYFTEAMFEQPSIQDLLVTPMFGSLMGEGAHQLTLKLAKNGFCTVDKIIVFVTNPAYVWNHAFSLPDSGKKASLQY